MTWAARRGIGIKRPAESHFQEHRVQLPNHQHAIVSKEKVVDYFGRNAQDRTVWFIDNGADTP
jgi:hypothetical protein